MDGYTAKILLIIAGYLLGSIPFGLIIAMAMGAGDIRKMGSGNIGATNVLRSAGKLGGFITFILDALKGVIPVLIAKSWWGIDTWTLSVALVAVLGHNYPVYLKFKGGKGVATSLGVITALWPYIGIITIGIWLVSVVIWRYSSMGALISFTILPIITILGGRSLSYFIFSLLISLMLFYRHKDNIKRLLSGQEKKIGKGGGTALTLLILILFAGNSIAYSGNLILKPTIPQEIQKIWDARRTALSAGDKESARRLLKDIVEIRYKLGINRIDDISALLIREGYQALNEGRPEDAYRLSGMAKEMSPSYAPSYYLSALSMLKMSKMMPALLEYIAGFKTSLQDFWTIFTLSGRIYTVVIVAIALTSLTFLVVWLSQLLPVFFHTFREITSGIINRPLQPIFFFTLTIFPFLFGLGWFVLFWVAGCWAYLLRKERMIAVFIVAFFLLLPQTLKYSAIDITAQENMSLTGLLAVERGYGDADLIQTLKDQYRIDTSNPYLPLSIAFLSHKLGDTGQSLNYYHKLINTDNKNIKIWALNNMGNLYFSTGDYDNAIISYKKAINEDQESAILQFNLSQAYREKLMFAEAESAYETAKRINPGDVGRFTSLSTRMGAYRIIDYPVSKTDLWVVALKPTEGSRILAMDILGGIINIPPERIPFLGISILIVLTVISYLKLRTPMAYYCPECGMVVCGWCTGSRIFGNTCKKCRRKDEEIEEGKELDRRISFILPGLWHIYKGRVGIGGVISLIFFLGLSGLILGGIEDTWYMAYYLPERFYIYWLSLIVLSYLLITLHLKYVKIRFNT